MKHRGLRGAMSCVLFTSVVSAWAQSDPHAGHTLPAVTEPSPQAVAPVDHSTMPTMDHSAHAASAKPDDSELRDPNAYSDGYSFSDYTQFPMRHEDHDSLFAFLRADRLEAFRQNGNWIGAYDAQMSYGNSFERAVWKTAGNIENKKFADSSNELLWSHGITTFWNAQLGLRHDEGTGPSRTWAAVGVQGLSPYWFEVDATLYLDAQGRTALNVESEYELLLTQKFILQPRVELNIYGKDDAARGIGAGIADGALGVRLRYEIRREFAPYVGVERESQFGKTASLARDAGEKTNETRWLVGLRLWY